MKKSDLTSVCVYVAGMLLITVPISLTTKQYWILVLVLALILWITVLCRLSFMFAAAANNIELTEDEIKLNYEQKCEVIQATAVTKIVITKFRYILYAEKRYSVSRAIGKMSFDFYGIGCAFHFARLEKTVNPCIYEISDRFDIPIRKRQWP